jgi:hypothetical protein
MKTYTKENIVKTEEGEYIAGYGGYMISNTVYPMKYMFTFDDDIRCLADSVSEALNHMNKVPLGDS